MIKEEQYEDLFKEDEIGATVLFNDMRIRDRFVAVLYLIDHVELMGNVRELLTTPEYKKILYSIRYGNKNNHKTDGDLVDVSMEYYHVEYKIPRDVIEEVKEEIIDEPKEDEARSRFYLLIRK
jgi:hypothetical protein